MKYWFRPKQFWQYFAAYYPASREGWIITCVFVLIGVGVFLWLDQHLPSRIDTLLWFVPALVIIFLVYDLLCFCTGEYPKWWRKRDTKL